MDPLRIMPNLENETTVGDSVELPRMESNVSSDTNSKRTVIEGSLKDALEKHFSTEPKPSPEAIAALADSLQLKKKSVHIWFANRRHKEKFKKRFTTIKTSPLRKTRLSVSRISTSDEIVDETAETMNNLSDAQSTGKLSFCSKQLKP